MYIETHCLGFQFKNLSIPNSIMGSELRVGDVMTKEVIVLPMGNKVPEAAKLMQEHSIGSVIVVDEEGKAKGIITERDIITKIVAKDEHPSKVKVDAVMSKPLRVITPDVSIEEASSSMRDNRIKRLPVVNEKKELIGIISEGDIMRVFPSIVDLIEERSAI